MKNIFILGAGRVGKSTLSRMVRDKFDNYDLIHTDSIRNGILFNLNEKYVDYFMDYQTNEFFQKVLLDFVDSQTGQGLNKYGVILEGAQILPSVLSKYKNLNNTIVVYLGHGNLTEKDIFKLVRQHDKEKDWSYHKTDEELSSYIKEFYEKNKLLLSECKKYGFKYFDTSKNREQVLNEILKYICEENKMK